MFEPGFLYNTDAVNYGVRECFIDFVFNGDISHDVRIFLFTLFIEVCQSRKYLETEKDFEAAQLFALVFILYTTYLYLHNNVYTVCDILP